MTPDPYLGERLPWHEVWLVALRPTVARFGWILGDRRSERRRGYRWVYITGTLAALPVALTLHQLLLIYPGYERVFADIFGRAIPAILFFGGVVAGLLVRIVAAINRILGGRGSYDRMAYAVSSYTAPLLVVTALWTLLPLPRETIVTGWLALFAYHLVLTAYANRAVQGLGWIPALLLPLLPPALLTTLTLGFLVVFVG